MPILEPLFDYACYLYSVIILFKYPVEWEKVCNIRLKNAGAQPGGMDIFILSMSFIYLFICSFAPYEDKRLREYITCHKCTILSRVTGIEATIAGV